MSATRYDNIKNCDLSLQVPPSTETVLNADSNLVLGDLSPKSSSSTDKDFYYKTDNQNEPFVKRECSLEHCCNSYNNLDFEKHEIESIVKSYTSYISSSEDEQDKLEQLTCPVELNQSQKTCYNGQTSVVLEGETTELLNHQNTNLESYSIFSDHTRSKSDQMKFPNKADDFIILAENESENSLNPHIKMKSNCKPEMFTFHPPVIKTDVLETQLQVEQGKMTNHKINVNPQMEVFENKNNNNFVNISHSNVNVKEFNEEPRYDNIGGYVGFNPAQYFNSYQSGKALTGVQPQNSFPYYPPVRNNPEFLYVHHPPVNNIDYGCDPYMRYTSNTNFHNNMTMLPQQYVSPVNYTLPQYITPKQVNASSDPLVFYYHPETGFSYTPLLLKDCTNIYQSNLNPASAYLARADYDYAACNYLDSKEEGFNRTQRIKKKKNLCCN